MISQFVKIALIALVITIIVTVVGTIILLRQVRKPESERKSEIFQAEHIDEPLTEKDWVKWDDDDWKKDDWADEWSDEWENWFEKREGQEMEK